MKKKFVVYYNDEVNEVAEVFYAETLEECKHWIDSQLECMMPVDDEHPCTDNVMYSANTFFYQPTAKRTSTPKRTSSVFSMRSTRWPRSMICRFYIAVIQEAATVLLPQASSSISALSSTNLSVSTITTAFR